MSTESDIDELERALDFDEPIACDGTCPFERLTITFADRSTAKIDAPASYDAFVAKVLAKSEPAPFGDGARTRTDAKVRAATRVVDRERARVTGFDPRGAGVLDAIERSLAPRSRVEATLTDVVAYATGGHFASHRDTPMEADMLGTLVVCLPVPYEGGALRLDDGSGATRVDLRATAGTLRWAAFHGDVDHAVESVSSGHRLTLVYRLVRAAARDGAERAAKFERALASELADPRWLADGGRVLVPCARRVILPKGRKGAPTLDDLRDTDREIADAASSLGLRVDVRPCVVASQEARQKSRWLVEGDYFELKRPLTLVEVAEHEEFFTFEETPTFDEVDPDDYQSLAHVLEKDEGGDVIVLARARAQSSLLAEAMFSATGYFGNEYYDSFLYAFVAVRIHVKSAIARGVAKPPAAPVRARVRHTKFGEGDVLAE